MTYFVGYNIYDNGGWLMKRVVLLVSLIFTTFVMLCASSNIYAGGNKVIELRVGLKQYYENVDSIHINNKSLVIGYNIDEEFIPEKIFMSNNGYTFKPTFATYLISKNTYASYDQANESVIAVRSQGYKAHVASAAKGIWKIYIMAANKQEANNILGKVNGNNNITYVVSSDNGYRTILTQSEGYPIILENTYQHPQFSTMDVDLEASVIDLGKRKYRGRLEIGRYNDTGITAINVVPINEYLYSVLPSEMIPNWPLEALKAQSVAARNYAVYYSEKSKYPNKPYDLCDTTSSQVYRGYVVENPNTNNAVNETTNELIYYRQKVIPAYFFSTSGGHTENSENVWSGTVPFLKGVPDIYETQPEKEPWIKQLTKDEIKTRLAKYDVNIGNIIEVQLLGYTDAKRVINLKIVGTNGEYIIKKETIRTWLGLKSRKFILVKQNYTPPKTYTVIGASFNVKSYDANNLYVTDANGNSQKLLSNKDSLIVVSKYNIDNIPVMTGKNNTYIFVGQGWGHGVGMSQSGAKGMALAGFTYKEILEYYYKGVEVR
jgi:stage II sporulation protein D